MVKMRWERVYRNGYDVVKPLAVLQAIDWPKEAVFEAFSNNSADW